MFGGHIQNFKQSVTGNGSTLEQIDYKAGNPKRLHNHGHVSEKSDKCSDADLLIDHKRTAITQDRNGANGHGGGHDSGHQRIYSCLAEKRICVSLIGCGKAVYLIVLLHHCLNGPDA